MRPDHNAVQGVQGFVQAYVQGKPRAVIDLCRVCRGSATRPCAHARYPTATETSSHVHVYTLHTLHTLHKSITARISEESTPAQTPAQIVLTPAQRKKIMPEPIKETLCAPDNAREFNAALREGLPEAHDLARALHKAGLIDGLRGARIGPLGALNRPGEVAVRPTLSAAAEARHLDRAWAAGTWQDDQAEIRAANREWMQRGARNAAAKEVR